MDNVDVVRVRGRGLRHLGSPRSASTARSTPDKMRYLFIEKSYLMWFVHGCKGWSGLPCAHPDGSTSYWSGAGGVASLIMKKSSDSAAW